MTDQQIFGLTTNELRAFIKAWGIDDKSELKLACPSTWTPEQTKEARARWYHLLHQERVGTYAWRALLKREYGIDEKTYLKMLEDQGGVCAICRGKQSRLRKRLDVDHNHVTGKVRGLLCSPCNTAIGIMREDETRLQSAIDYLKRTKDA